jgi:hypothetical protein
MGWALICRFGLLLSRPEVSEQIAEHREHGVLKGAAICRLKGHVPNAKPTLTDAAKRQRG